MIFQSHLTGEPRLRGITCPNDFLDVIKFGISGRTLDDYKDLLSVSATIRKEFPLTHSSLTFALLSHPQDFGYDECVNMLKFVVAAYQRDMVLPYTGHIFDLWVDTLTFQHDRQCLPLVNDFALALSYVSNMKHIRNLYDDFSLMKSFIEKKLGNEASLSHYFEKVCEYAF